MLVFLKAGPAAVVTKLHRAGSESFGNSKTQKMDTQKYAHISLTKQCNGPSCRKSCDSPNPEWKLVCTVIGTEDKITLPFCSGECRSQYYQMKRDRKHDPRFIDLSRKRREPESSTLIDKVVVFVKDALQGNDSSHDWSHIQRVWNLSKVIGTKEGAKDMELVELGALLHDIGDWKYEGGDKKGLAEAERLLNNQNMSADRIKQIFDLVKLVGFNEEIAGTQEQLPLETKVVQDADRLDALGAIGIARTFAYGGSKKHAMYDPNIKPRENLTQEQYKSGEKSTTINHFYEKLLKIKDMMKTETGKEHAIRRHCFMEMYLQEFFDEWEILDQ